MTDLAPHLTAFLREHLPRDRNASPHTVATYAHCFALLVRFAAKLLGTRPSDLKIEDLGPDLVLNSSTRLRPIAATALARATPGLSQSGHSFVTSSTKPQTVWTKRCVSERCQKSGRTWR